MNAFKCGMPSFADIPTTLIEAIRYFGDDQNCHDFLAAVRWPEGAACPHCQSANVGKLVCSVAKSRSKVRTPGATFTRRLWNCKACRKQFTVKSGTIFENSPIGLEKWLPAVWLITNAKNGISSYEVARSVGVRQKAAWFMCHRIRLAMREGTFEVAGEAEADEVYIGGKVRNMTIPQKQKRYGHRKPTGHSAKQPVLGILQRSPVKGSSRVVLEQVSRASAREMGPHLLEHIKPGTWLYTDAHKTYQAFSTHYIHAYVDHAVRYVDGKIHTNGLENFWSLLKRTLGGTYVRVLPAHLYRYLDEQACRFNERADGDRDRFLSTMQRTVGRRLPWSALTGEGVW
jgi:transposase-like protein